MCVNIVIGISIIICVTFCLALSFSSLFFVNLEKGFSTCSLSFFRMWDIYAIDWTENGRKKYLSEC